MDVVYLILYDPQKITYRYRLNDSATQMTTLTTYK